jgi:rod shape-determining protein MreC
VQDSRRTRAVLGVLLLIALALITLDFRDGGASPVRNVGAEVFGPIERVTDDITNPVSSLFDSITGGPSSQGTIANLQRENDQLRAELSAAQLNREESRQLARLLRIDAGAYRIVAATVIAAGGDYSDTVTLDAGSSEGIKRDETVLNGAGFVGTVTQVSLDTCTVVLASDASSIIGVQMAGTSEIGEVTGTGKSMSSSGLLRLSLFDANAVLQPGQEVVTYASVNDHPEVPGVPVGTVVSVHSSAGALVQTAVVQPFVNFTALGVVGIVVGVPKNSQGISILPRPAPTVTVTTTPPARPTASVFPGTIGPSATGSPSVSPSPTAPSPTATASGGG